MWGSALILWGCLCLNIAWAVEASSGNSATGKEPPTDPVKPKPKPTGGGSYTPPVPVNPFPFPPKIVRQDPPADPPPRPFIPSSPPPKPPEVKPPLAEVKKPVKRLVALARPRPWLFRTRHDRYFRSVAFVFPFAADDNRKLNDQSIMMDTVLRESRNDLVIARHELENDRQVAEANQKLFSQQETLYNKKVIARHDYEEAKSKQVKSDAKVEETRQRVIELETEVEMNLLRLAQTQGQGIPLGKLAQLYVRLWQARRDRAKAAVDMARAEVTYRDFNLSTTRTLVAKGVNTSEDLINNLRDATEANVVLKLALKLVDENEKNLKEAKEHAESAELLEKEKDRKRQEAEELPL